MPTLAAIERRLARLEARARTPQFASRPDSFTPKSLEATRIVLKMLVEMGALTPPLAGMPDRWENVRRMLSEATPSADDNSQQTSG